jgi:taurine transport system permease protein
MTYPVITAKDSHSRQPPVGKVVPLAVVALTLTLWFALTPRYVPELVFPSPQSVLGATKNFGMDLLKHSGVTLGRVMIGWLSGSLCGVLVGLAMTRSKLLYDVAHPFVEAVRPLPTVVLIPFFILWFGIGNFGQVLLIFLSSFMTLTIHTYGAVYTVRIELIRAASSLGGSVAQIYWRIIVPNLLPSFKPAFQIAAGLAFAVGIAAEFMGAQSGIGFLVMVARRTLNTDVILLGTLIIGLESFLVDLCLRRVFDSMCHWAEPPVDSLRSIELGAWR